MPGICSADQKLQSTVWKRSQSLITSTAHPTYNTFQARNILVGQLARIPADVWGLLLVDPSRVWNGIGIAPHLSRIEFRVLGHHGVRRTTV